ncbi:MAG TPA: hypothetical protein VLO29_05805 [Salegentibacter sp.]|nr:hypothetical protein [Salegentibacter sp.]
MKTLIVFISIIISVSGCESAENSQQVDRKELDRQLEGIKDLIAQESCDDETSCDYIAVGSKACGGPKTYLLFPSSIDRQELKELVDNYNKSEADFNQKYGIVSDCMFITPPEKIGCVNGKCETL